MHVNRISLDVAYSSALQLHIDLIRTHCEYSNNFEVHNVLFVQATGKMTISLHVVLEVYTGFCNAKIIGNVKRVSQYVLNCYVD